MVITYSRVYINRGKVANRARGQLNRENEYFSVPVRGREFCLARRVRPSRLASACSFSTLRPILLYGSTGQGRQSCLWSAEPGKCVFPYSRSRLRIWSHETGLAIPRRVSLLILHTQAKSDVDMCHTDSIGAGVVDSIAIVTILVGLLLLPWLP